MKSWRSSRTSKVDLEGVVREAADVLKAYRCHEVISDRYAAGWAKQAWERNGIKVVDPVGDRAATYLACEPLFAQGLLDILDHDVLARELRGLERRPRPGGRIGVDHPRGHHDDHANALCLGAAHIAAQAKKKRPALALPMIIGHRPRSYDLRRTCMTEATVLDVPHKRPEEEG